MPKKVAIVEVAQLPGAESGDNMLDQLFRVCREAMDKAGITRDEIGTVVSAASDVFHGGVSCANAYFWDSGAAFLKNGTRQDGESLLAFQYAVMRILSGHYDTALVFGIFATGMALLVPADGRRVRHFLLCFLPPLLIYFPLFVAGPALGRKEVMPPWLVMWLPILVVAGLGSILLFLAYRK